MRAFCLLTLALSAPTSFAGNDFNGRWKGFVRDYVTQHLCEVAVEIEHTPSNLSVRERTYRCQLDTLTRPVLDLIVQGKDLYLGSEKVGSLDSNGLSLSLPEEDGALPAKLQASITKKGNLRILEELRTPRSYYLFGELRKQP